MDEKEKNRGGRPRTGRLFPNKAFAYLTDEELSLLKRLAARTNGSGKPRGTAGTLREGLKALAEKEGER